MADSISITIADGAQPSRAFAIRRPTHGELDATLLLRLIQSFGWVKGQLEALDSAPGDGAAVRSANLLALLVDTMNAIIERVRRCLGATATPEVDEWLNRLDDAARAEALLEAAAQIVGAIVPAEKLPK